MNSLRLSLACASLVCSAGLLNGREAVAQSTTSRATASGLEMMPIPMPLFTPAPSSNSGNPATASGGPPTPANIFSNPYASPFLYSSMLPGLQAQAQTGSSTLQAQTQTGSSTSPMGMLPAQMGLMMLATQRPMGIGSGQLSGARPGPGSDPRPSRNKTTARQAIGRSRGSSAQPGGLAARYFNRIHPHSPYPQSYYNRQNRYFP